MRKFVFVLAAFAGFSAASAEAQVGPFTGWGLGANLNLVSTSAEVHNGTFSGSIGDTDTTVSLQAGYGLKWGQKGVLGLGLSYRPVFVKAGSEGSTAFKSGNMYSIHIEPGYVLSNESLLYAKIAYLGMQGESSSPLQTDSRNFRGIGYGAGARMMLSKNLYLQVEVMQAEYNELRVADRTYNPSSTTGSIGVGYQFWK